MLEFLPAPGFAEMSAQLPGEVQIENLDQAAARRATNTILAGIAVEQKRTLRLQSRIAVSRKRQR
jgi:hypothetical protein